jgi:thiamine biosynthesis lipoprotein
MGTESGIHLINQLDGVEVVIIDSQNKIYNSLGISFDTTKANK